MNVSTVKHIGYGFAGTLALLGTIGVAGKCDLANSESEKKAQAYNDSIIAEEQYKTDRYNNPLGNSFKEKTLNLGQYLMSYRPELQENLTNAVNEYNIMGGIDNADKEYAKILKNDIKKAQLDLDYCDAVIKSIQEIQNPQKSALEHKKDSLFLENIAIPEFENEIRNSMVY